MFARCVGIGLVLLSLSATPARASLSNEIFSLVESISLAEQQELLPEPIYARELITHFYHLREYRPAWVDSAEINDVLDILAAAGAHGLNPEDYHLTTLRALAEEYRSKRLRRDRVRARFDVLLSDGVLLYSRHMLEGKVDPSVFEESWNYSRRDFSPETVAGIFSEAVDGNQVPERLREMEPDREFYRLLQAELVRYRSLAEQHQFITIPDDTVLRLGMRHSAVPALRVQLQRLGMLSPGSDSDLFDEGLEEAVKVFQYSHGLDEDGIVGRGSFRELNTSYAERIQQLQVNLDRVRWVREDLGEDFLVVNVAGFELYLFKEDQLALETDVMVGTIKHQTPFFHGSMKYLVFNPTWTVPPGIKRRSTFPKFAADPNYPVEHNYKLYNTDGEEVDPLSIDYSQYSPGRFPFRVVQQPGPENALGRVKFIFPNKYSVFLHDTPNRELFSRTSRAFSSGCIRVREPLELARILLEDPERWSDEGIEAVLEQGEQKVVHLPQPMDVLLMYWTASPTPEGGLQFHPDIYERDEAVRNALAEAPRWDG